MKIKRKIHEVRIRMYIKSSDILYTLRCTVNQIETELQCTFLCRILTDFVFGRYIFLEKMSVIVLCGEYVYCFMEGCFFSMANCVSHTCFISFFTSSTSALYMLPVAFMRLAIWFRLPPIFPSAAL